MVWRAWTAARDYRTVWRLQYNLAPNDPKVLAVTEDEMLHDLMVLVYYGHERRRQLDPKGATLEDLRAAPDLERKMDELEQEITTGKLAAQLASFQINIMPNAGRPQLTSIKVGSGKFGTGGQ